MTKKGKVKFLIHRLTLLLFAICFSSFSQNHIYTKGVIIDSVEVLNTNETYALYLPEKFGKNKLSSIVFIFEPAARGKIGIQPFIESSEKFNHILICSNNNRNGPLENNFKIINRLFDSVFDSFNIDKNLVYTAGFSGGSRLATTVAVLTKQIQGVIACGAGFSPNNPHIPITKENFSYVGLIGDRDMNYQEMLKVREWLNKFQIDNELYIYEDDHRWPPSKQILKAFFWLELQLYKKQFRQKNDSIINEFYLDSYNVAKNLEVKNQLVYSVWENERIVRNFSRYFDLDSIKKKNIQIKNRREYTTEKNQYQFIKNEESKIRKKFIERFNNELDSKNIRVNYKWWNKELKKFNDENKNSNDSSYIKMRKRINYALYAMAIESSYSQLRKENFNKALYCHEIVAIMLPNSAFIYFLIAKDYAMLNNKEELIRNLQFAKEKGFNDKELLLNTKEFQKYMNFEKFKLFINEL